MAAAAGAAAFGSGAAQGASAFGLAAFQGSQSQKAFKNQRRFIKKQRATAYQTAVTDLRLAGLNPILAATNSPLGGQSPGQAAVPDYPGAVTNAVNSARENYRTNKRINAETELLRTQDRTTRKQGWKHDADTAVAEMQTLVQQRAAEKMDLENQFLRYQLPSARAVFDYDRSAAGQFGRKFGRAIEPITRLIPGLGLMIGPRGRMSTSKGRSKGRPQDGPNISPGFRERYNRLHGE